MSGGEFWHAILGRVVGDPKHGPKESKTMASVAKLPARATQEQGTVHWLRQSIERGKRAPFGEVVTISPGLAKVMLDLNDGNRTLRPVKVRHFARDMKLGRWPVNGQSIIISDTGELNDGQHRLNAIIEANVSVPTFVAFGPARETRTTVDQGTAKTAGDYLQMNGQHYGNVLAAVARYVLAYEESDGQNLSAAKHFTNADLTNRALADKGIAHSVEATAPFVHAARPLKMAHSVMAFAHYAFDEDPAALDFIKAVATGENIKNGQPAFVLRSKLLAQKVGDTYPRDHIVELLFRAWSFEQRGMRVKPSGLAVLGYLPALV